MSDLSSSDLNSIRPNPLMDRSDNDGPGHSFGKGVQCTNRNKNLNPTARHNERLIVLNLQKRSLEELKIVDVAHERLDKGMLDRQRLTVRLARCQHLDAAVDSSVHPVLIGISPRQVVIRRQECLDEGIFWTRL